MRISLRSLINRRLDKQNRPRMFITSGGRWIGHCGIGNYWILSIVSRGAVEPARVIDRTRLKNVYHTVSHAWQKAQNISKFLPSNCIKGLNYGAIPLEFRNNVCLQENTVSLINQEREVIPTSGSQFNRITELNRCFRGVSETDLRWKVEAIGTKKRHSFWRLSSCQ